MTDRRRQALNMDWLLLAVMTLAAMPAGAQKARPAPAEERPAAASERRLAGLQPGRDTLAHAVRLYGKRYSEAFENSPDLLLWADARRRIFVRLELADDKTIDAITVSSFGPEKAAPADLPATAAVSGRGLKLGDPLEKCLKVYGPPYFRGPSSEGGRELLLVVYKFAVGEDLPQVLETSYDPRTLRLVKMTLSFPYY